MDYYGKVQSKSGKYYQGLLSWVYPRKESSQNFDNDLYSSVLYSLKKDDTSWSQTW